MDKGRKVRKKQAMAEDTKAVKKRKLAVVEEAIDKLEPSEPTLAEPAVTPAKDPSIDSLRKDIYDWMQEQYEYEKVDLETLLEESNHSSEHEEAGDISHLQTYLGKILSGYTATQIRKSFKYECEWRKCTFMSGTDRRYFLHVESHAEQVMDSQSESYACEWDLCDFITEDSYEYMGHVHYHAYHTKLKVHGASVHMLAKLPSCNNDSRARNTITNKQVTFRCDWADCNERFNKAMHFFHHVRNHMCDQFPANKRSMKGGVKCLWSLCKDTHRVRCNGLYHIKRHTTEREIACFNCGTCFYSRIKLANHHLRQVEISQRKFECQICGRFYASKPLLNAHVEAHDKPYECTLCPMKCPSNSVLANHMLRRHLKQRNFRCNQCEYAAFSQRDIEKHMRTHDSTKILRCEEFGCNVAFRSEYAMKKHFAWHYNIPPTLYGCHLCSDKTYKNSYHLTKHLRFVHQVERNPGHVRFAYKADSDGVFRLATHVEQKMRQQRANVTPVPSADTVSDSLENNSDDSSMSRKGKKSSEKAQEPACEQNQETISHETVAYAPIKGKPKINSVKSIGVHEFLVELGIEPEPAETEQQQQEPQAVESKSVSKADGNDTTKASKRNPSEVARVKREGELDDAPSMGNVETTPQAARQPKDVKDFTVMKRYLKPSKKSA